jgi:hypothetical protein
MAHTLKSLVVPLVLAATLSPPSSASCVTDEDCGLLGDCINSDCVCDPGWVGPNCLSLDLQPSPVNAGFRQTTSDNWCGTITPDPVNSSLFHMFSSDFGGCGLEMWTSGSRILHTTAVGSPLGPYSPMEVAVYAEAHNPQLIRVPNEETYLIFDSYGGPDGGCPMTGNYTGCKTGPLCAEKGTVPGAVSSLTIHFASSPSGPWQAHNASIIFPCASKNLTPSPIFHPNGTAYVMFHCDPDATHSVGDLVMVSAPTWRGPFTPVNARVWARNGLMPWPEDPFLFLRTSPTTKEVSFHAILHNSPRGIHLYSRDGLDFTVAQAVDPKTNQTLAPYVYTENITQVDGSILLADRRERPWLLFDDVTGAPSVLVTAVSPHVPVPAARGVFTHAAPIGK